MKHLTRNLVIVMVAFLSFTCQHVNEKEISDSILKSENFKKMIDGKQTNLYFLENGSLKMAITNYGGRIVSLSVPDRDGEYDDIVLGFKSIEDYLNANEVYHGATIGRVANRIADGKFTLEGVEYTLPINNKTNQLHGGEKGFHNQVWDVESYTDTSIVLSYFSKDGEMGYPGNLNTEVTYSLTSDDKLEISYKATTDKSTPVMLTNHAFWNLSGEGSGTINNHVLNINADSCIRIDPTLIPTGQIASVEGTVFNFRKPKAVSLDLSKEKENEQLQNGKGYDYNWPLNKKYGEMSYAGSVFDPASGRKMEVYTEEPVLLFYGGNFLNGSDTGKYGTPLKFREAFCLETQHFPDAPNHDHFPSIILDPNETYTTKSVYKFVTTD